MPFQLLKLQKVSFSSIFADATLFPLPDWFITEQKGDSGVNKWGSRCESSLCKSILTIHYWCCIFVIRTSFLHYPYQVHGQYHRLPTLISMRTFWPLLEPTVCGAYRRYLTYRFLFLWKHRFFYWKHFNVSVAFQSIVNACTASFMSVTTKKWDRISGKMLCPLYSTCRI